MINDIIFRGKTVEDNLWVEGYFVACIDETDPDRGRIPEIVGLNADHIYRGEYSCHDTYGVRAETVSQWTGKLDVNNKKIFGGDIVQFCEDDKYTFEVGYHGCEWCLVNGVDSRLIHYYCMLANYQQLKVIGNIWDNPELLGRKECVEYERGRW